MLSFWMQGYAKQVSPLVFKVKYWELLVSVKFPYRGKRAARESQVRGIIEQDTIG